MSNTIKWHTRFINLARHIASWSKDPSTKVGAVIVNDMNQILGLGYNGFPRGIDDYDDRYDNREIKYKMVVHAEANATLNKIGDIHGTTLYVTPLAPCCECAKLIIQSGISTVIYETLGDDARWGDSNNYARLMFREAGVRVFKFKQDRLIKDL